MKIKIILYDIKVEFQEKINNTFIKHPDYFKIQ